MTGAHRRAASAMAATSDSSFRTRRPVADWIMLQLARAHSQRTLQRFMRAVRAGRRVQDEVLFAKLRRNALSDFGRAYGFSQIRTYAEFVRQVPILHYEDLAPYIERVKNGDFGAMFGRNQSVRMFAKTSGTTDQPKYIPVTDAFLAEYRRGWNAFGVKAIGDHPGSFLRPIVQVASPMDEEFTAAKIPCGAITGLMAATQKRLVRRYYVVPPEVAYIPDADARYYCVVRFAVTCDPAFFITASPATQLRLARTLDGCAESLIRDVRDGTLAANLDLPDETRAALTARLAPDAACAARLESIRTRTDRLLPRDVWHLGFLANWTGGTMGLYLRDFPEYFGDTPVRDVGLIASEGRMSIPIADGTASGLLNVPDNFYEFIPAGEYGADRPTVLRAHELTAGAEYFILLTTSAGLYRYDIGDRVRVTDHLGETPLIEFLHKGVHASSLTGEKLTEQQAVLAFGALGPDASGVARTFVLAPQWGNPPHYRLHVEEELPSGCNHAALAATYDARLQAINIEYASKRDSGRLGGVVVNVLPRGFLAERNRTIAARQRAANEQFKHCYLLSAVDADAAFPLSPEPELER
ncbi:MAG: GH3 auxin-responsive promoter family protein [Phycisphaerales bacterium]|nr:GH3 auxin-responsive promoter family protein [Phycisphaerales bacterium]